jgi:YHS domain-containing protein
MKALAFLFVFLSVPLWSAVKPYLVDGLALQGYDAVSYFEGSPSKGSSQFETLTAGATYCFASQKHLDLFKAHPEKYEPAYGGWCAYGISQGALIEVNPLRFKILSGRLLLFYDAFWNNTLNKWNADESKLSLAAESNWKAMNSK